MGTAEIIAFPRKGLSRRTHARRPHPLSLQARLNAAAAKGYAWGVQDCSPFIALAFLAGVFLTFVALRWI